MEGSNDVTAEGFQKTTQFIKALAMLLQMGPTKARFAMVQYSSWPETEFMFKASTEEVFNSVDKLKSMGWFTKTGLAINHATNNVVPYMRDMSDKIVIVLTANESQDSAKDYANNMKNLGVKVYAIGVGAVSQGSSLDEIASEPASQFVWKEASQEALVFIAADISKNVCEDSPPIEIPDPCNSDPCQNQGLCASEGGSAYYFTCDCQFPFFGIHCENEFASPCGNSTEANPCENEGECMATDNDVAYTGYACDCSELTHCTVGQSAAKIKFLKKISHRVPPM